MAESIGLAAAELQRRAVRGATWSTVSATISLPLSMAVSVVLARGLGPDGFARFALLAFLVPLLHQVTDLGYAQATTREASSAFAAGDLARTRELVGKALGWNLARLPVVLAVTVAVARPNTVALAVLTASIVLIYAGSGLNFALNAENRGAVLAKLAFVQGLAAASASIGAAVAGASPTTVWALSFASALAGVPGWLLAANPALRAAALRPRLPRGLGRGFWRYALGALAASLGYLLVFSRSEILVLHLLHREHALAVFALAYGLSQRLTTPVDTVLGPLIPALAGLSAAHPDRVDAGLARALRLAAAGVAFLAGGAVVGTAFLAPVLFGPEYRHVGAAFAVLAVVSLLQSAAQPYTALAYAVGRPVVILRALAAALALDVAACFGLIPVWGIWGAVAANAAGGLCAVLLTARWAAGTRSAARAQVPVLRLCSLAVVAAAASLGAGAAGAAVAPALAALLAFAAGPLVFVALARASGGLLSDRDADALLEPLPAALARPGRALLAG